MNCRIFTLLISILSLNLTSFAQSEVVQDDPVKIEGVKFEYVSPSKSKKKWAKAEIKVASRGDLEAKAAGQPDSWLRNVEVELICAYDTSDKQQVWFAGSEEFVALEKGETYSVIFYIPYESLAMNKINKHSPEGYVVNIRANGNSYPLNAKNYRGRTSATTPDRAKTLYDAAEENAGSSSGRMLYYEDAPFAMKYNDGGREQQPTPVQKR